ncbi:hypothetical protein MRX96_045815 [Rhipicephalus microplus]
MTTLLWATKCDAGDFGTRRTIRLRVPVLRIVRTIHKVDSRDESELLANGEMSASGASRTASDKLLRRHHGRQRQTWTSDCSIHEVRRNIRVVTINPSCGRVYEVIRLLRNDESGE